MHEDDRRRRTTVAQAFAAFALFAFAHGAHAATLAPHAHATPGTVSAQLASR